MSEEKKSVVVRVTPSCADFLKEKNLSADTVIALYKAASETIKSHPVIDENVLPEEILDAYFDRCEAAGCDIIQHDTTASFLLLLHPAISCCANISAILNRSGAVGREAAGAAQDARKKVLELLFQDKLEELPKQQYAVLDFFYQAYFMSQFFVTSVVRDDVSDVLIKDGSEKYEAYVNSFLQNLDQSDEAKEMRKKFGDLADQMRAVAKNHEPKKAEKASEE